MGVGWVGRGEAAMTRGESSGCGVWRLACAHSNAPLPRSGPALPPAAQAAAGIHSESPSPMP